MGVAAAVGVNYETSSAQATIANGLTINSDGKLTLQSANSTGATAAGDGSAASAPSSGSSTTTEVGVGVAVNIVNSTNQATIGTNDTVNSQGLTLSATMNSAAPTAAPGVSDFEANAVSGASSSGGIGVAGSFALNLVLANNTTAQVGSGSHVNVGTGAAADDVLITAVNDKTSSTNALAKASAGGKSNVGVGASISLDIETNDTYAQVLDGATLTGAHDVTLSATSSTPVTSSAQAGASATGDTSGATIGGAVDIAVETNDTAASLGSVPSGSTTLSVGSFASTTEVSVLQPLIDQIHPPAPTERLPAATLRSALPSR